MLSASCFKMPENLGEPAGYEYYIKIKGTGGMEFENTTRGINYEEKSSSVLVQTDKAIYKPGQTGMYMGRSVYC